MKQIKFKRGDTFTLTCTYKVDGVATSVTDIDIESQIRSNNGTLVKELTVTKQVSTGVFLLSATATESALWPTAALKCDVQFSQDGVVRSTQTFDVIVVEDITK